MKYIELNVSNQQCILYFGYDLVAAALLAICKILHLLVASQDALNVNFFNQFKINRRCGFARFVGADWLRLVLVLELLSGLDLEFGL